MIEHELKTLGDWNSDNVLIVAGKSWFKFFKVGGIGEQRHLIITKLSKCVKFLKCLLVSQGPI